MEIKQLFKSIRERGMSDAEIAAKLKVSTKTISNWEKEVFEPRPDKLQKLKQLAAGNQEEELLVDRSIILEALIRSGLKQLAKDRAERRGEPENWRDYLAEIDADTVEEMNKIALKLKSLRS